MSQTNYIIEYFSEQVQQLVLTLPEALLARYFALLDRMEQTGSNLGEPHTKAFGDGLFELRLKASEGIARGFLWHPGRQTYCCIALFCEKVRKDATQGAATCGTTLEGD